MLDTEQTRLIAPTNAVLIPVYRRLGFRTYCRISRYLWRNPNA